MLEGVHAAYLDRLGARLVGPRRARRDLLQEVADHLEDATDAYRAAGYDVADAAALARRDLGTVDELVPAFQETLAVAASRRTAWILLGALVLQPFLWDNGVDLAAASHVKSPDEPVFRLLDLAVEAGGFVVIVGAVLALAATGVGHRWFRIGRPVARATAVFALAAGPAVVLVGVAMTAMSAGPRWSLWLLVLAFLVVPFGVAGVSARRTLAAC